MCGATDGGTNNGQFNQISYFGMSRIQGFYSGTEMKCC